MAGFQLLGLTDWPGFGPAFVGVLDTLVESKGLIAPSAFRRFCAPTVPLLQMKKRIWTTGETLFARVDLAHYGPAAMDDVHAAWSLRDSGGRTVGSGSFPSVDVPAGGLTHLGEIRLALTEFPAPGHYSMQVSAGAFANDWDLWIYPENLAPAPPSLTVSTAWDNATRAELAAGRTVVLLLDPRTPAHTTPTTFTTAFWALSWFPERNETMGILCEPSHAALAAFPTDAHAKWQWWDLMSGSRTFVLNSAPRGLRPLVRVIDDAARSYRLGAVIEARVGPGKLLAIRLDLVSSLENRLAARQLRYSLLQYAGSHDFAPAIELDGQFLDQLFAAKNNQ